MADGLVAGQAEASVDVAGGADEAFFRDGVQWGTPGIRVCNSVRDQGSGVRGQGVRDQGLVTPRTKTRPWGPRRE